MARRVLLMTQWFDPEPTFKGMTFARELRAQGWDVDVLTGFPNYPGGKLYAGHTLKWRKRETIDGVELTRVWLYPSHDSSKLGRIANYVSFMLSAALHGLISVRRPDVIYSYHPPLTTAIAAIVVKFFRRAPVLIDIQDLWPDTLRATGMIGNERVLRVVNAVSNWVYRRVDHIVVLSPGFKRLLIERGVPEQKIDVIYNWADEVALSAPTGRPPSAFPAGKFKIVFAGNMGRAQALDAVLEAASTVEAMAPQIHFLFIGGGLEVERLKASATSRNLHNVSFLPPVPMAEIGSYLGEADALLVHLRRDPLFEITIPSKTQAYMASGRPILMAVAGDAARLVELAECGVTANPEDSQSIVQAAMKLAAASDEQRREMAFNARRYYQDNLSVSAGVGHFSDAFKELCQRSA